MKKYYVLLVCEECTAVKVASLSAGTWDLEFRVNLKHLITSIAMAYFQAQFEACKKESIACLHTQWVHPVWHHDHAIDHSMAMSETSSPTSSGYQYQSTLDLARRAEQYWHTLSHKSLADLVVLQTKVTQKKNRQHRLWFNIAKDTQHETWISRANEILKN